MSSAPRADEPATLLLSAAGLLSPTTPSTRFFLSLFPRGRNITASCLRAAHLALAEGESTAQRLFHSWLRPSRYDIRPRNGLSQLCL